MNFSYNVGDDSEILEDYRKAFILEYIYWNIVRMRHQYLHN